MGSDPIRHAPCRVSRCFFPVAGFWCSPPRGHRAASGDSVVRCGCRLPSPASPSLAGPQAQPGGIVAVLKKVAADFAKMEAGRAASAGRQADRFEDTVLWPPTPERRRAPHTRALARSRAACDGPPTPQADTRAQEATDQQAFDQDLRRLF